MPGLATWGRVRDYRVQQIQRMNNVQVYLESRLDAQEILEFGSPKVVLATGGTWRRDGIGRWHTRPLTGLTASAVFTPEDVFAGRHLEGPVVIFDDDHYYLGGLLAEKLRQDGLDVTLVTPAADVSKWTHATLEQGFIEKRLHEIGVSIIEKHALTSMAADGVYIQHVQSGRQRTLPCASVLLVTMRLPNDSLYQDLAADAGRLHDAGILSLTRIGDCLAPSTIAAAVYAGHRYAREADVPPVDGVPFQRELIALA
jgi:dimethylamine/trimethylamine dehydrogenase